MEQFDKARWSKVQSFSKGWNSRSEKLFKLLMESGLSESFSYTEYGCGPFKPFRNCCIERDLQTTGYFVDMVEWESGDIVLDLDFGGISVVPDSEVAVLSGVIEYLSDVPRAFQAFSEKHKYILFSYRAFDDSPGLSEAQNVIAMRERVSRGWKNHYSYLALVQLASRYGYIINVGLWHKHYLFLMSKYPSANEKPDL